MFIPGYHRISDRRYEPQAAAAIFYSMYVYYVLNNAVTFIITVICWMFCRSESKMIMQKLSWHRKEKICAMVVVWTWTAWTQTDAQVPKAWSTPKNRAGQTVVGLTSGQVWGTCQKWFWLNSSSDPHYHFLKIQFLQCKKLYFMTIAQKLKSPKKASVTPEFHTKDPWV